MAEVVHLCYWLPGIQLGKLNVEQVREMSVKVDSLLPAGEYVHKVFNWEDEFDKRQEVLWAIGKKYGNWLCRQVKEWKIKLGMDMGWYLLTKRGMVPGFLCGDLHIRLYKEIEQDIAILKARGFKVILHLVSHSWGTKVALDFAINHPEFEVRLVTMGSPNFDLAGGYEDWGDPDKLANIKSWVNIFYPNDPICTAPTYENPGPNQAKWQTFVRDIILPNASMFPMKSHGSYWTDKNAIKEVAQALKS